MYSHRIRGERPMSQHHKNLIAGDPHALEVVCAVFDAGVGQPYVWSMRRYMVRNFAARIQQDPGMKLLAIIRRKRIEDPYLDIIDRGLRGIRSIGDPFRIA